MTFFCVSMLLTNSFVLFKNILMINNCRRFRRNWILIKFFPKFQQGSIKLYSDRERKLECSKCLNCLINIENKHAPNLASRKEKKIYVLASIFTQNILLILKTALLQQRIVSIAMYAANIFITSLDSNVTLHERR